MQKQTPLRKRTPFFRFVMKVKKGIPAILLLTVFATIFFSSDPGRPVAAEESRQLSGRLGIGWADPLPGSGMEPRAYYSLIHEDGTTTKLNISPKLIESAGGAAALSKKHVRIEGIALNNKDISEGVEVSSISLDSQASLAPEGETPRLGSLKYINILCTLTDGGPQPHPPSYYTDMLGEDYPELGHYWRELSYDQMNITGSATAGWYSLPYDRNHYLDAQNSFKYQEFSEDCAGLADPDVYFPDYYGINFATNSIFEGGIAGMGHDFLSLSFDGGPRTYGGTWNTDTAWIRQSILAHEMGHSLGLPHTSGGHGSNYDSSWDVMSNVGTSVNHPVYGTVGPHTISQNKNFLGWVPSGRLYTAPISGANTINLVRLHAVPFGKNRYLMAKIPIHGSYSSYYTVELRDQVNYDQAVPAKAVVIHKTGFGGTTVVDSDGNTNPNDAGAQWTVGETFYSAADRVSVTVNYELSNMFNVTIEANSGCTFSLSPGSQSYSSTGGNGSFDVVTQSGCYWALSGADPVHHFAANGFEINDAPATSPYIGLAATYPSTIAVSGLSGSVTKITATLTRITHPSPGDLDILLAGPNQEKSILMSDAGGNNSMTETELTFDNHAANYLSQFGSNAAGSYKPTDYGFSDIFPSPGPGTSIFYSDLDRFNGMDPNGDWKLFAVDDFIGGAGSITRIWNLDISTGAVTTDTLSGVGPQTVNYTVTRNYGSARTIYLTVAGQTFTITQSGV